MNSQNQQTWLNPDNLVIFLDELRDADYNIGVDQYIAAQDLVLALTAEGINLDQPQRFKNMLGSLLCNSPQEQEDFGHRFDQWVERMGFVIATEDSTASEKAIKLEQELIKVRKQSKRWKWAWLFISGIVAVLIIGASIAYFSSSPIKVIPPGEKEPSEIVVQPPTPIEWQTILIALLVILVTFLIWRWMWRRRANLFWKRNATTEKPKLQEISIADNDQELFPNLLYLKIAQQFRKRIKVKSTEIDIEKTFAKTLENAGWYSPVYETRQIPPEYLFLIDRASYGDHQAKFITEMIDRLDQNGVFITGYYFDHDPRICFPMTGKKSSRKLAELAAKYSHHRLVVFSEAERLFSPVTGELESWVEIFSQWQESAVLTPKPVENWGYEELELAEQFMILPATAEGLRDFIKNLEVESSPFSLTSKDRAAIPDSFQERPLYWIDREPPEDYLIAEVLPSLKKYLGQDGYLWLSACAIFPELHWNLTLYLGNALKNQTGTKTLLQTCNLSDMARLPWFRYGYMPDWLRLLLIAELSPEQDQDIRAKLSQLLVNAVSGSVSGIQLEIAKKHRNSVSKIAKPLLKLFTDKSSKNSPLRDYIFQDFMAGKNEKLAVKLPNNLRQIISDKKVGWRLLLKWSGLFVLVSLTEWNIFIYNEGNLSIYSFVLSAIVIFTNANLQLHILKKYVFKIAVFSRICWCLSQATLSVQVIILFLRNHIRNYNIFTFLWVLCFAFLIYGIIQYVIIYKILNRRRSWYWLLSTCFSMIAVWIIIIYINEKTIINLYNDVIIFSIYGSIQGILYGVATGASLVCILRQPVIEK